MAGPRDIAIAKLVELGARHDVNRPWLRVAPEGVRCAIDRSFSIVARGSGVGKKARQECRPVSKFSSMSVAVVPVWMGLVRFMELDDSMFGSLWPLQLTRRSCPTQ
jgi:hypothetical protein